MSEQGVLEQMYAAFNARDAEGVLAQMTPDVHWPRAFEGDHVNGTDAVRAYWAKQWTEIDPHVEPTAYETLPDGKVDVTVHQVVRALDGALLFDGEVHHVYTFRDGLIAAMDVE